MAKKPILFASAHAARARELGKPRSIQSAMAGRFSASMSTASNPSRLAALVRDDCWCLLTPGRLAGINYNSRNILTNLLAISSGIP